MGFIETIHEKARQDKKRIVFPECANPVMMSAAARAGAEGLANIVLLGVRDELEAIAEENGIDLSAVEIIETTDEAYKESIVARYAELPNAILSQKSVARRMKDPLYMGLAMEAVGDADVTFAGLDTTTFEFVMAAQGIIGLAEGVATPSILVILEIEGFGGEQGNFIGMSDGGICVKPTSEQLAGIAASCCDSFQALVGREAACAFLSYSTDGSGGAGEDIDRVREGVRLAREMRPDLKIDGEFQADAALNAKVGAKKVKRESDVAGKANVLIFPDIASCNIGSKMVQQFANARTYGPVIQGFRLPVVDCSRGDTEQTVYNNIAVSSVLATYNASK